VDVAPGKGSAELATLLLRALEHHADAFATTEALEHQHSPARTLANLRVRWRVPGAT
jgi:hypothetical protein